MFNTIVDKHKGDKGAKGITCRTQFIMMLFAHIGGLDSLRESQAMKTLGGHLNHLGIDRVAGKSSLSYVNAHRPWEIFRDMFDHLVKEYGPKITKTSKPGNFKGKLISIDSTTIDLCLSLFTWAEFHHRKGAVKIHAALDHDGLIPAFANVTNGRTHDSKAFYEMLTHYPELFPKECWVAMDRAYNDYATYGEMTDRNIWFVTRAKSNACYKIISSNEVPQNRNIIADDVIELTSTAGKRCGYYLRRRDNMQQSQVWG